MSTFEAGGGAAAASRKLALRLPLIFAMLTICFSVIAETAQKQRSSDIKTLCVGRFLIDVPDGTDVNSNYVYAKKGVSTASGVSPEKFLQEVDEREAVLAAASHRLGGSMFVSQTRIDENAVLLTSWLSDTSKAGHRQELYVFDRIHGVRYLISGETDASQLPAAIDNYRELRPRIRYRAPDSIPSTAGFCIDSGFISGNRINSEEMTIGLRTRAYTGARMTLMSYVTGRPDRPLLQRSNDLSTEHAATQARIRNLRRGERAVGPIQGQEILAYADEDGKHMYAFLWESQGRAESLQFPFLSLQLLTDEQVPSSSGFSNEAEAVAAWDQLLDSLRLRPGAI